MCVCVLKPQHVQGAHDAIAALVGAGAYVGKDTVLHLTPDQEHILPILRTLQDLGLVTFVRRSAGRPGWQFSQDGMQHIALQHELLSASLVLEPRARLPLVDATTWDLLCQLEAQ